MSKLITVATIQEAINNVGLPEKITRTQLEYWRVGTRAVVRALNDAIQAAPPIDGVAYTVLNPYETRGSTDLTGVVQACPEGLPTDAEIEALARDCEYPKTNHYSGETAHILDRLKFAHALLALLQNQQQIIPEIIPSPSQSDAPPRASIDELTAFRTFIAKKGISDGYMGDGVFRGRIQLAWEAWLARAEAATVPAPPADKAGVSGSEASVSDKPACGAQSSEYDPQAQREAT